MKLAPQFLIAKYNITFADNDDFQIGARDLRELVTDFADSIGQTGDALGTAQLLGTDPATGELLVLLSPGAPTALASYVLAEYAAGGTVPPPATGNNYVASGYVASGYVI